MTVSAQELERIFGQLARTAAELPDRLEFTVNAYAHYRSHQNGLGGAYHFFEELSRCNGRLAQYLRARTLAEEEHLDAPFRLYCACLDAMLTSKREREQPFDPDEQTIFETLHAFK